MPKVEIDLEQLAAALNAAVMSLVKPVQQEAEPVKRGRGRPKKNQLKNLKTVEECENIKDVDHQESSTLLKPSNIFNPKGFTQEVSQVRPKREYVNLFHDDGNLAVADKIPAEKYPPISERRPPAQKQNFVCNICGKAFTAYPSEMPSAFVRLGDGREATKPIVRCDDCIVSVVNSRVNLEN